MPTYGREAVDEFNRALLTGSSVEVGQVWDAERRWRVYLGVGPKRLVLAPAKAIKLAREYQRRATARGGDFDKFIGGIVACAKDAKRKNAKRLIPQQAVEMMPSRGTA